MRYVLTPQAKDDLKEIRRYIADDNPDAAIRVVHALLKRCRGLAERLSFGKEPSEVQRLSSAYANAVSRVIARPSSRARRPSSGPKAARTRGR